MTTLRKDAPVTFMEGFTALWLILSFVAMLCIVPALGMAIFMDNPNTVKHSVDATLIDAHPYSQSTGKYSSELRWEGRFQLLDGRTIDQDIDGFFYKRFMAGNEAPIKSWIAVSGWQLGKPDPIWVGVRDKMFAAAFIGLVTSLIGMLLMLACPNRR